MDKVESVKSSDVVEDAMCEIRRVVPLHRQVMVSISGGSDSDMLMDMVIRSGVPLDNVHFVFCDTGIEYEATRRHVIELEKKYGVTIHRVCGKRSMEEIRDMYGVPFISKEASEYLYRLQHAGFEWSDEPFEVLLSQYEKSRASLKWWTNHEGRPPSYRYCIRRRRFLKEYILSNPPSFRISNHCCRILKTQPLGRYCKEMGITLVLTGVRMAEGGIRATSIKGMNVVKADGTHYLYPLWYVSDSLKEEYCREYDVVHSDCYTVYGLKRTGCAGCPIGVSCGYELEVAGRYEPELYDRLIDLFGPCYEYTRGFKEYAEEMRRLEKEKKESE